MSDALISTSLRWLGDQFAEAGRAGRATTVEPAIAATMAIVLAQACDRLEEVHQLVASDDLLRRELAIALAESERLRLQLAVRGRSGSCRLAVVARGPGEVVDISEELRREQREAGRPVSPEGGAA